MDRMGVDVQVMYPTLSLVEVTERPEVALALRRSYNRWLADRWARSGGRLRWIMLPPLRTIDKTLEELRFAKDHGACGLLKKGDREAGCWPADPYFFSLYEEAQRLDLPICFHTGSGTPDFSPARQFPFSGFYRITLPVVHAFQSLILQGVPARFPTLRFGFHRGGRFLDTACCSQPAQTSRQESGATGQCAAGYKSILGYFRRRHAQQPHVRYV
jgi:predicted TIM-barrel fold metal-dependent hydrolase